MRPLPAAAARLFTSLSDPDFVPYRDRSPPIRTRIRRCLTWLAGSPSHERALLPAPPYSLGRLAIALLVWLLVSGILLTIPHEPSATGAWPSITAMQRGSLLMAVSWESHRWDPLFLVPATLLRAA